MTDLKSFTTNNKFRNEFIVTVVILIATLFALTRFLKFVEQRQGITFNDPVLALFQPVDLTWLTFVLIYVSLLTAVIILFNDLPRLTFAVQCYVLMVWIRMAAMYLLPLDPPSDMITLKDPFVEIFGTGETLTKDLFFSGHTATLLLLFLVTLKQPYRKIFFVSTLLVGLCVILQHVHYSIDVFAALFFSYGAYRITMELRKLFNIGPGFKYC